MAETHKQKPTVSSVTGQFVSPENADPATSYQRTDDHDSPTLKECKRLLKEIERSIRSQFPSRECGVDFSEADTLTVQLVVTIQAFKQE